MRAASRLANKLDCEWHALYVETPALQRLAKSHRRAILDTLKLAQDLGAQTATKAAADIAPAIVDYTRQHGLGWVVVGRGRPGRWRWFRRALPGRLARLAPDLDLLALARDDAPQRSLHPTAATGDEDRIELSAMAERYGATPLICLGTALLAIPLLPH